MMQKGHSRKKGMSLQLLRAARYGYVVVVLAVSPLPVLAGEHAFHFEERTLESGKRIKAAAARHVGEFGAL